VQWQWNAHSSLVAQPSRKAARHQIPGRLDDWGSHEEGKLQFWRLIWGKFASGRYFAVTRLSRCCTAVGRICDLPLLSCLSGTILFNCLGSAESRVRERYCCMIARHNCRIAAATQCYSYIVWLARPHDTNWQLTR